MKPTEIRHLYRSPNGDSWFLVCDPATRLPFVRHEANLPSGGQVTDIDLDAFLSGPGSPEHEALLRLIGASLFNSRSATSNLLLLHSVWSVRAKVERHLPQMGRLTNGGQLAIGNEGMRLAVSPDGARRAECRKSTPQPSS